MYIYIYMNMYKYIDVYIYIYIYIYIYLYIYIYIHIFIYIYIYKYKHTFSTILLRALLLPECVMAHNVVRHMSVWGKYWPHIAWRNHMCDFAWRNHVCVCHPFRTETACIIMLHVCRVATMRMHFALSCTSAKKKTPRSTALFCKWALPFQGFYLAVASEFSEYVTSPKSLWMNYQPKLSVHVFSIWDTNTKHAHVQLERGATVAMGRMELVNAP